MCFREREGFSHPMAEKVFTRVTLLVAHQASILLLPETPAWTMWFL